MWIKDWVRAWRARRVRPAGTRPPPWRPGALPPDPDRLVGRDTELAALHALAAPEPGRIGATAPPFSPERPMPHRLLGSLSSSALTSALPAPRFPSGLPAWERHLLEPSPPRTGSTRTGVILGPPGAGKTALAVHAAYLLRRSYPDGVLYLDLRGSEPDPLTQAEALGIALRALGAGTLSGPSDMESLRAHLRGLLAERRMLLVYDDAGDPEVVDALVPVRSGCLVLVASREPFELPSATVLRLEPLADQAAAELFRPVSGRRPGRPDPVAVTTIAHACDRLPLALCVMAAALAARPATPPVVLADQLLHERLSLEHLGVPDAAVQASLTVAYATLSSEDARLFRRLAVLPGPDFGAPAVADLIASSPADAVRGLDRLVVAALLERGPAGRYRLVEPVRTFAVDRLEADDTGATRRALRRRMLTYYLSAARKASETAGSLRPGASESRQPAGPPDPVDALAWFDQERLALTAALRMAVRGGESHLAWRLAAQLGTGFELRGTPMEWIAVLRLGMEASRASRDPYAAAVTHHDLGDAHRREGHLSAAEAHLAESQKRFAALDCPQDEARALVTLGRLRQDQGNPVAAVDCYRRALAIFRAYGLRRDEIEVFTALGVIRRMQGRLGEAAVFLTEALTLVEAIGADSLLDQVTSAVASNGLGAVSQAQQRPEEASAHHATALATFRALGDRRSEATALHALGECEHALGRLGPALELYRESLALFTALGDARGSGTVWRSVGLTHGEQGWWPEADRAFERSVEAFRVAADRHAEGLTLLKRARILPHTEGRDAALSCLQLAEKLLAEFGGFERQLALLHAELNPDADDEPAAR